MEDEEVQQRAQEIADNVKQSHKDTQLQFLRDRHDFLLNKNTKRANALAEGGLQPTPESMIAKRLEMVIEFFLGDEDSEQRLKFEIIWQEYMEEVYDRGEKQLQEFERQKRLARLNPGAHPNRSGNGGIIAP